MGWRRLGWWFFARHRRHPSEKSWSSSMGRIINQLQFVYDHKPWMSIVELGSWANEPTYLSSGPHIAVKTQPFQLPRTPSIPRWSSVWFRWPTRVIIPATIWFWTIDIAWKCYRMLIPSAIFVQFSLVIESSIWKITIVNWKAIVLNGPFVPWLCWITREYSSLLWIRKSDGCWFCQDVWSCFDGFSIIPNTDGEVFWRTMVMIVYIYI